MSEDTVSISVVVRSFVTPPQHVEGFEHGKRFPYLMSERTTLGELVRSILGEKADEVGVMAVNGHIAKEDLVLSEGDVIDLHEQLAGG
jgi:molybdopterin converting factor small subunit